MFVRGTSCELTVGAGDGRFGIWLDSNLNQVPFQSTVTMSRSPTNVSEEGPFNFLKILDALHAGPDSSMSDLQKRAADEPGRLLHLLLLLCCYHSLPSG